MNRFKRVPVSEGTRNGEVTTDVLRDLDHSLPIQMLHAREAAMSRFRPLLRAHGLTEQQWRVIRVLAACQNIDASELARRAVLLAPSLSRILQHLEDRGLINRHADEGDQRRAVVFLSRAGRALYARVAPDSEKLYQAIADAFGEKKLATLYQLLADFSQALSD